MLKQRPFLQRIFWKQQTPLFFMTSQRSFAMAKYQFEDEEFERTPQ